MQTPYGAATGAESALSTTQKVMLVLVFGAALYGLHVAAGGFEPEPAHARRRVPHTVAPPKPSRLPNRRRNGRADDLSALADLGFDALAEDIGAALRDGVADKRLLADALRDIQRAERDADNADADPGVFADARARVRSLLG